ncbi:MAG: efflux RND transporter periplasmic adaptor subunit [candidate division Zixibacteria bacterium]|nr:efflux RND transporter periplasmic adaptor subunit [candidate division Zixibacteria bacterium]
MRSIYVYPLVLIGLFASGCGNSKDGAGSSGFIEADESVISSETGGQVQKLNFTEGTAVRSGDTLLVIDSSKLHLQLASLKAARQVTEASLATARLAVERSRKSEEFATAEKDRVGRLIKSGSATQKQFDQLNYEAAQAANARQTAEANVATTRAQLEKTDADIATLDRQLRDCTPLAPINGVITEKYVDAGELVAPGKAMAKIARLDSVWVKVYLTSDEFANVKIGDAAVVNTEAGGKEFSGTVVWTSSESEFVPKNVQTKESRSDLVYAVKVRVPNTDRSLKIGQPVYVHVTSK